jgi:outer membrane protein OmpA-like peptidoglycan-associated protein
MKKRLIVLLSVLSAALLCAQIPQVPKVNPVGDAAYNAAKDEFNKLMKDIPFAYGSSELKLNDPSYNVMGVSLDTFMKQTLIPALSKLINLLPAGKMVIIEGHACKTGSEEASTGFIGNLALSKNRADAVKQYILSNSKVDGGRFKLIGNGSANLKSGIDATDTKNCRVDIRAE